MLEVCVARKAPEAEGIASFAVARLAFVQRLADPRFGARVKLHCDDGPEAQRFDAEAVLTACDAGTHLYVCGPTGFMDHVLGTARRLGWSEDRLHREYFSAPAAATSANDGSFELLLKKSRKVIRVAPDQTALQALTDAGVQVESSCEQGICGTCLTSVLDGDPDHPTTPSPPRTRSSNRPCRSARPAIS